MIIVFDASTLISASQTCLIKCVEALREKLNAEFVISPAVFNEIVSKPIGIRRFELTAVRLNELVEKKEIKVIQLNPSSKEFVEKIDSLANNLFFFKNNPIRIMQSGELESLALVKQLDAEALAIDERTTRMLIENPFALRSSMEKIYKKTIQENKENIAELRNLFTECNILRSVELIAMAFEMDALAGELEKTKKALEAALYAAKFSGCSVSFEEIDNFLQGI